MTGTDPTQRAAIRRDVEAIRPLDRLERDTVGETLHWIDSGAELCRLTKPATPPQHLVAYFVLIDGDYLLLVDHRNAGKWLPTGGHVEPGERPFVTAQRECREELHQDAVFIAATPLFITRTVTTGLTAGHTDVSLWYALRGNRQQDICFDTEEFHGVDWFHRDALPGNTDPHLHRFTRKFYQWQATRSGRQGERT